MDSTNRKGSSGQTLVQAAMLTLVFLAFMVIAIDMGHIYNERRRMQNAADAAALAGAWEVCFGDPSLAVSTASEYAIDRNGAQIADVSVITWTVAVRASEQVDTYLAGIFGIPTADVGATAEAVCGAADRLCGIWPLSFHIERWERIQCWKEGDPDDVGRFYVFNDGRFEAEDPCYDVLDGKCYPACDLYDVKTGELLEAGACKCNEIPPDNDAFIVGEGGRGWLLFPRPRDPFDHVAPKCTDNCGDQVRCWIDYGSYGGQVPIPNTGDPFCLPGEPGVTEAVRIELEEHIGDRPNVLLWDRTCYPEEPVHGNCMGDPYHIVGMGCIEITAIVKFDLMRKEEFRPPDKCMSGVKVMAARKLCKCTSACGGTSGTPPWPGAVRAVSLIK